MAHLRDWRGPLRIELRALKFDGAARFSRLLVTGHEEPASDSRRGPYRNCTGSNPKGPVHTQETTMLRQLTAIIEREGDGYVALCPDVDIASQGETVAEARDNLKEALELFFETASASEIKRRLHEEVYVTHVEVAVG